MSIPLIFSWVYVVYSRPERNGSQEHFSVGGVRVTVVTSYCVVINKGDRWEVLGTV